MSSILTENERFCRLDELCGCAGFQSELRMLACSCLPSFAFVGFVLLCGVGAMKLVECGCYNTMDSGRAAPRVCLALATQEEGSGDASLNCFRFERER